MIIIFQNMLAQAKNMFMVTIIHKNYIYRDLRDMFTPQEIIARWNEKNAERVAEGKEPLQPSINLAVSIAGNALIDKVQWSGEDYMEHPLFVGMKDTDSTAKQIIGILHDVVEDSDWILEDLANIGFDDRIIRGLDGVTKREGETYFDFIVRCSLSGDDAIDVKLKDLYHNSINVRSPMVNKEEGKEQKGDVYNISYWYLVSIKQGKIQPGTSVEDFIDSHPDFSKQKDYILTTLFSNPRFGPAEFLALKGQGDSQAADGAGVAGAKAAFEG